MSVKSLFQTITTPATKKCTGSIIFLHGSGATGPSIKERVESCLGKKFSFTHLRIHYPTAPLVPYSLNGGFPQAVWFDRSSLDVTSKEDLTSIDAMCLKLNDFIEEEIQAGIDPKNIMLGGFSMGGCLALHFGLRYRKDLKGIFCLSSFLARESKVYEMLKHGNDSVVPPIFMACGKCDDVIDYNWSLETQEKLISLGLNSEFLSLDDLEHFLNSEEIVSLRKWILKLLPQP